MALEKWPLPISHFAPSKWSSASFLGGEKKRRRIYCAGVFALVELSLIPEFIAQYILSISTSLSRFTEPKVIIYKSEPLQYGFQGLLFKSTLLIFSLKRRNRPRPFFHHFATFSLCVLETTFFSLLKYGTKAKQEDATLFR